jgi:RNA 3'-terminal phosphate cyclase (ATP)
LIQVDGAYGESGGQIVRTALTLSLITQQQVQIDNIRAGRRVPGLRPQHVTAAKACAEIAPGSEVTGASVGSEMLQFQPGSPKPGRYNFEIAAAGSMGLLLQTIALPLAFSGGRSLINLTGGSHVPGAPCFEFLRDVWAPWLWKMRMTVELTIEKTGFYPQGGGAVSAQIHPQDHVQAIRTVDRHRPTRINVLSLQTSDLAPGKERRQTEALLYQIRRKPKLVGELVDIERGDGRYEYVRSTGTVLCVVSSSDQGPAGFQQLGARDKSAEGVGERAAKVLIDFLESGAAVDPHTADQILLPLSLAERESEFTTPRITAHIETQMHVIKQFLDVEFLVTGNGPSLIRVTPG